VPDLRLEGCSPEPLAHYLKALGVLRLVSEQVDPHARGYWDGECFCLRSTLGAPALLDFFASRYAPTPLLSPWNGGSGFFAADQKSGIDAIAGSDGPRFAAYRRAIAVARRVLSELHLDIKPGKEQKPVLVEHLRGELDDSALSWLDAALVLTDDGLRFPPLLGTGGNDGRLEFGNNQMQRLAELLLGAPTPALLRGALFGEPTAGLLKGKAIGQFLPAGAGGANASPGFDRDSFINPWNYVLMLEGALLFAAAVTRKLESLAPGSLAFPFTVRASASGYASSADSDEQETRDELWLPLWRAPASLAELRALFSEGRAKVRRSEGGHVTSRAAASGVDFARAVTGLGVDRGLHSFVRFGFHVRNGLSYLATPLGRWRVPEHAGEHVELLTPLDRWLGRFRRAATGAHAPASHGRALRRLEGAILRLCETGTSAAVQAVLVALGDAEAILARSRGDATLVGLGPVPALPQLWLERADDDSVEFRLAAALASADLRTRIVPVRTGRWLDVDDGRTVWGDGDLVRNLLATLQRDDIERAQGRSAPPPARRFAALADLTAFIDARTDDHRLEALARGLALIDWPQIDWPQMDWPQNPTRAPQTRTDPPPAAFAALALAHNWCPEGHVPKRSPGLLIRAAAGDTRGATAIALRRLRGYGLAAPFKDLDERPNHRTRLAAALAFPLDRRAHAALLELLLPYANHPKKTATRESTA